MQKIYLKLLIFIFSLGAVGMSVYSYLQVREIYEREFLIAEGAIDVSHLSPELKEKSENKIINVGPIVINSSDLSATE